MVKHIYKVSVYHMNGTIKQENNRSTSHKVFGLGCVIRSIQMEHDIFTNENGSYCGRITTQTVIAIHVVTSSFIRWT